MNRPGYLNPFVLSQDVIAPERLTDLADLYLPAGPGPFPLVVLVPGLGQEQWQVGPREWPVFTGYASALVDRGVAAVVMDHDLRDGPRYDEALQTALHTLETAAGRADIDGDRNGFWVFSAGGPVALALLARHADRFGCLALTYPLLESGHLPDWPTRDDAVAGLDGHPMVVTTVERELPSLVPGQQAFLTAARTAGADLEHILVADADHGFDSQEATPTAAQAVTQALDSVAQRVARPTRPR